MKNQTPMSLKVFLGRDHKTEELLLVDDNHEGQYLCKFLSSDEAIADEIVRRVNAHDALVKRIEILGRMIEKATGWTLAEIAEQVAVSAKAEGK